MLLYETKTAWYAIHANADENGITERFHKTGKYTEYVTENVYTMTEKQAIKAYETAAESHVKINCGARNCNTCRRCYSRRTAKLVNELLK